MYRNSLYAPEWSASAARVRVRGKDFGRISSGAREERNPPRPIQPDSLLLALTRYLLHVRGCVILATSFPPLTRKPRTTSDE